MPDAHDEGMLLPARARPPPSQLQRERAVGCKETERVGAGFLHGRSGWVGGAGELGGGRSLAYPAVDDRIDAQLRPHPQPRPAREKTWVRYPRQSTFLGILPRGHSRLTLVLLVVLVLVNPLSSAPRSGGCLSHKKNDAHAAAF